jgi:copper ion binding protein
LIGVTLCFCAFVAIFKLKPYLEVLELQIHFCTFAMINAINVNAKIPDMEKLLALAAFIFCISLTGCKTNQSKDPKQEIASVNANTKIEIHVNGMHCTGCENTIKTNVKELKGVTSVEASYKENKAVVSFDSTLTSGTAIVSAINDAGYKVDTFIRK